jgi:thioredoxin-related protein
MSAGQVNDFDSVKQEAAKDHKLILLRFTGSDWCPPCKAMEKMVFEQDTFEQFAAAHLVMVEADFPHDRSKLDRETRRFNRALSSKYQREQSYPYTVLLDAGGRVLKTWHGYGGQSPEDYMGEMSAYLPSEN